MFLKSVLATASLLSCALTVAANAQAPVAFIGGSTTYQWADSGIFGGSAAYKWESYGFKVFGFSPCVETNEALQALQVIINSGQKPLIHLMVGAGDADGVSSNSPADQFQEFQGCFENIIATAQNAKLKIIVGTNPYAQAANIDPYNKFIFAYAASKGIPVIDYQTLLTRANDNFEGTDYFAAPSSTSGGAITSKGYALMNSVADRAIARYIGGVTLKAGYLGNEYLEINGPTPYQPGTGGNTVTPGTQIHWYAYGQYSDGLTRQIDNANVLHEYGTWTTSNPEVISIDPFGNAWALSPGTANIHFTTLNGQTINEWVMYVDPILPILR